MMNRSFDAFRRRERFDEDAIDRFMTGTSFPLVEGSLVTFLYRGTVDNVYLHHWIYGLPSAQAFARLGESNLWFHTIDLPPDSRVEYKFEIERGGQRELITDPLNPLVARDPFGANSVVHGSAYSAPEWTRVDPAAPAGTIEEISVPSEAFGARRSALVYLPAHFRRNRRYPLLVAHDGDDYLEYSALSAVLDNLIHRLEIPPLVVALTRPEQRNEEYTDNPTHARYLTRELVPFLEDHFPLHQRASSRALLGASFGAVASLSTAWRYPRFYGGLLLQSGSFAFTDIGSHRRGPEFDRVVEFVNAFRRKPGRPAERLFVSCGVYESLIYENRSLVPLLQDSGLKVRYVESRDGHNWENWRDQLREGLAWLFPGPLWMVYE